MSISGVYIFIYLFTLLGEDVAVEVAIDSVEGFAARGEQSQQEPPRSDHGARRISQRRLRESKCASLKNAASWEVPTSGTDCAACLLGLIQ